MLRNITFLLAFFSITNLYSNIWKVGPSEKYTKPSSVSGLVSDGDTVDIIASEYKGDVTSWSKSNLLIRGVNGTVIMTADGKNAGGKAIWVVGGTNVSIENIDFSGCKVPDKNGAGIRYEGKKLYLKNCSFHENEMGILTINDMETEVYFESCQFYNNGYGDGYSHNIYIGRCKRFEMKYCYSHHAKIGHNVKSRASVNVISYNRIMDEETGTSSMLIDLPNGGDSYIIGNDMMEGPLSENRNLISYGLENNLHTINNLYVINNTMISKRNSATYINANTSTSSCVIKNNIFAGNGVILGGLTKCDSLNNLYFSNIADAKFIDANNFNFKLSKDSPCIDKCENPGTINNFSLEPIHEYNHPLSYLIRVKDAKLDIGAHEFKKETSVFENQYSNDLQYIINNNLFDRCVIYDLLGYELVSFKTGELSSYWALIDRLDRNRKSIIGIFVGNKSDFFFVMKD